MLKIEYKPGKWRWLSSKVNDTVSVKLGRFLVILLTKMKLLFTFYNKKRHSYEENKTCLHVSTACVH